MAKALKTVATVVGAAVAIAAAIPSGGTSLLGLGLGLSAASASLVAAGVGLATSLAGNLLTKKPSTSVSISGNQTQFTSNPDQGVPMACGRTAVSGFNVHDITYDAVSTTDNGFQTFFGAWSLGPIQGMEAYQINGTSLTFQTPDSDTPTGTYYSWMWLRRHLGQCPEPAAFTAGGSDIYPPGWSATSKLSGLASYAWTLRFDTTGTTYPGGTVPQPRAILNGVKVYDPRQDSTFPGGSGPCRAGDESTYVWEGIDAAHPAAKNPFLHALTWAIGRFQNGKRVMGIGMTLAAIDVPAFANAANIADANNWTVSGVVYSTDGKLDVLRKILAAGSGAPLQLGGMLSCEVDTPRVSLATITDNDIIGDASVVSTPTSSARINGVIPSYRSEDHDWQIVPAAKVQVADYVTADGKPRTKAITWELVNDAAQVGQLATYAICNAREFGPIVTPLKLRWIGYKPGDALTINSDNLGQQNQLVIVKNRHLDPATATVTLTMRSETTGKHAFALGQTATPPPTPSLGVNDPSKLLQPGIDASWPNIVDPLGTKPDDNATNSRNPLSPFGDQGKTVADALALIAGAGSDIVGLQGRADDLSAQATEIIAAALRSHLIVDADRLRAEASVLMAGQKVSLVLKQEIVSRTEGDATIQEQINLLGVVSADGSAFVLDMDRVLISPTQTLAGRLVELTAELQGNINTKATVDQLTEAVADEAQARATALQQLVAQLGAQINQKASVTSLQQALADQQQALATTSTNLQVDYNGKLAGKASTQYVDQAKSDAISASAQSLQQRAAQLQGNIDQKASQTDLQSVQTQVNGKTSASDFQKLQVTVGQVDGRVTSLREAVIDAGGGVTTKAVLALDSNGHVVGFYATNDGTTGTLTLDFDKFVWLRPGSNTPLLYTENGIVKMPEVEIGLLKVNTAVAPLRVVTGTYTYGTDSPAHDFISPHDVILSGTIYMPLPGWIEVSAKLQFGFQTTDTSWAMSLQCNGNVDPYSQVGGYGVTSAQFTQGSFYASATGSYTIDMLFAAHTSTSARERSLFIKGFPATS